MIRYRKILWGMWLMDIKQLEYFVAVADHQSITKGAAAMLVSQPTVSQQIQLLERELGQSLFERHANGVTLTDAGNTLLRYSLRILQNMQEAIQQIRGAEGIHGTVRVCVLPTLTRFILPTVIKNYNMVEPTHRVMVTESDTQTLLRLVTTGDIDIALLDLPLSDPLLYVEKLWTEKLIFVAPKGWSSGSEKIGLHELKNYPFITTESGYGLRDILFRMTQKEGFNPTIAYELTSLGAIIGFVQQGFGISLLPERSVRLEIQ